MTWVEALPGLGACALFVYIGRFGVHYQMDVGA